MHVLNQTDDVEIKIVNSFNDKISIYYLSALKYPYIIFVATIHEFGCV